VYRDERFQARRLFPLLPVPASQVAIPCPRAAERPSPDRPPPPQARPRPRLDCLSRPAGAFFPHPAPAAHVGPCTRRCWKKAAAGARTRRGRWLYGTGRSLGAAPTPPTTSSPSSDPDVLVRTSPAAPQFQPTLSYQPRLHYSPLARRSLTLLNSSHHCNMLICSLTWSVPLNYFPGCRLLIPPGKNWHRKWYSCYYLETLLLTPSWTR
jgi:hypothetical protein